MTEASEAAMEIHRVTVLCASLERLLKARGAIGFGMGQLVQSVSEDLPPEISSKLMDLASVRNRVIHQAEPLGEVRMHAFEADAQEVETYLEAVVLGQLTAGDKSDVSAGLLPIRSGPIALTASEAQDARVARQRSVQVPPAPVRAASVSFSPPPGHPSRLVADRRAALRKASLPSWCRAGVVCQVAVGLALVLTRHVWAPLLPAVVSLVAMLLVSAVPVAFSRRTWPVAVLVFGVMSGVLVWGFAARSF